MIINLKENFPDVDKLFLSKVPTSLIQRLGYLLEHVLNQKELANSLFDECKNARLTFFRIPLKARAADKCFSSDDRWKVIVNTEIEIDE